jgi:fumarylacetoacetate (FAA) hydrolase
MLVAGGRLGGMRLASLRADGRDGVLVVVARSGDRCARASAVVSTLQAALDDWERAAPALAELALALDSGRVSGEPLDIAALAPPLPRAYEWIDASAYLNHIVLVRRARGAEPPEGLETEPLVYQGGSGVLLGARDAIVLPDSAWGLDFEAEVCVVLGDTPRAVPVAEAEQYVRLLMLANDVTYRNLVPAELKKGFGFFQSKPATAFSPFAVTPDELGPHFRDGRVYLRLRTSQNGVLVGDPEAGEMHFSFFDLIAHVTKTRAFTAGTILGSGTVSNADRARGVSCLAERRVQEILDTGAPTTAFLRVGDTVRIEMLDSDGHDIFGSLEQRVVQA